MQTDSVSVASTGEMTRRKGPKRNNQPRTARSVGGRGMRRSLEFL